MIRKGFNTIAAIAALTVVMFALCSCVKSVTATDATISVTLPGEEAGTVVYLLDYDTQETLDSTVVNNDGVAQFAVKTDGNRLVTLVANEQDMGVFVLEGGDIVFDVASGRASGTELNTRMAAYDDSTNRYGTLYSRIPRDSLFDSRAEALMRQYLAFQDRVIEDNADNAVGLLFLTRKLIDAPTLESFEEEASKYPAFAKSRQLDSIRKTLTVRQSTMPGRRFTDFSGTLPSTPDSTIRLSQFVGQGKLTLVDFWASWCAPCIRETANIKEILRDYADNGLNVVGVGVWDDPKAIAEAIQTHSLPWQQIITNEHEATDLYGINSIPCILLIDGNGTIVERGLRGDELRQAVEKHLKE